MIAGANRLSLLAMTLIIGSCADKAVLDMPPQLFGCGISAAIDYRRPAINRYSPPACELPDKREVASACSVHDTVTAPNYLPPDTGENGELIKSQPLPVYKVRVLRCAFSSPERNQADCQFELWTPADRRWRSRSVPFEFRFVPDHGPTHHAYYTMWMAKSRCAAGTG